MYTVRIVSTRNGRIIFSLYKTKILRKCMLLYCVQKNFFRLFFYSNLCFAQFSLCFMINKLKRTINQNAQKVERYCFAFRFRVLFEVQANERYTTYKSTKKFNCVSFWESGRSQREKNENLVFLVLFVCKYIYAGLGIFFIYIFNYMYFEFVFFEICLLLFICQKSYLHFIYFLSLKLKEKSFFILFLYIFYLLVVLTLFYTAMEKKEN